MSPSVLGSLFSTKTQTQACVSVSYVVDIAFLHEVFISSTLSALRAQLQHYNVRDFCSHLQEIKSRDLSFKPFRILGLHGYPNTNNNLFLCELSNQAGLAFLPLWGSLAALNVVVLSQGAPRTSFRHPVGLSLIVVLSSSCSTAF